MKKISRKMIEEVVRKVLKESKTASWPTSSEETDAQRFKKATGGFPSPSDDQALKMRLRRLNGLIQRGELKSVYKIIFNWVQVGAIRLGEFEKIIKWLNNE